MDIPYIPYILYICIERTNGRRKRIYSYLYVVDRISRIHVDLLQRNTTAAITITVSGQFFLFTPIWTGRVHKLSEQREKKITPFPPILFVAFGQADLSLVITYILSYDRTVINLTTLVLYLFKIKSIYIFIFIYLQ